MILADLSLRNWAVSGGVKPFDPSKINPASIDLTLQGHFVCMTNGIQMIQDEYILLPGDAVLVSTQEFITMPDDCAGAVYLKSSRMREGLDLARAGWIDPGFRGEITLLLYAHAQVILKKGKPFVQLVLSKLDRDPDLTYQKTGRYNNQVGPTLAK